MKTFLENNSMSSKYPTIINRFGFRSVGCNSLLETRFFPFFGEQTQRQFPVVLVPFSGMCIFRKVFLGSAIPQR